MKLGVLGNRFFHDYDFIKRRILDLFDIEVIDTIICRDTSGVDALVKRFADDFNLKKDIKKPDWEKHEKEAPSICNQEIVDSSDCIFAFPLKSSGSTWDTIRKAQKAGKEVFIFEVEANNGICTMQ